jgi:hypothetical protein
MNQNQNRNENKYQENEFLASFSQSVTVQKMDNNIIKNCDKMGDHIDFVNNVYDTVKVPLHYLSNKVQKMIGVVNNNHDDARVSNKIEDSNNAINDDEYLFTENE